MTDEEQEARSLKFDPRASVTLRQLSTGRFALYPLGGVGSPFWIGPIEDLASAYAARPVPVAHTYVRPTVSKIDTSKLDFRL